MILLLIEPDVSLNNSFIEHPECAGILSVYPDYYNRVGFNKPWIGYFATVDGVKIVGCGGYKGQPQQGRVEIAYGTFKNFEGQGNGIEICRQLVLLSLQTDPSIKITARTLMETSGSATILERNGFKCLGVVFDKEDGYIWEWEFQNIIPA